MITLHILKVLQYKKRLGVKLNFFLVLFQIAKIKKWLKTINSAYIPSFEAYFIVFAKTDFDGYKVMHANDFNQDKHGKIVYNGKILTFKEFKKRVKIVLSKPIENNLKYENLKDTENFFKNYKIPYNSNLNEYAKAPPTKSNSSVYIRLKIMALAFAYMSAKNHNNSYAIDSIYSEVKSTFENHKNDFTETEEKLFADKLNKQELIDYSWNFESLYALCYVCDVEEKILFPNSPCAIDLYSKIIKVQPSELKINTDKAITMINLYHALLWTIRDQKLKHKKTHLNSEIVQERYKALVWLFKEDTPFDKVVCDTQK